MNLKPTLLKSIISLILGIITDYLFSKTVVQCMLVEGGTCPQPVWIDHAFDLVPVIISLIVLTITYFIWSLIQKKK